MDRRQLIGLGGLVAATTFKLDAASLAETSPTPSLFKGVNFTGDGLELVPREYAALLQDLTISENVHADNYSNGGFVADLETLFAQLLGKQRAVFLPTGTLANHLAVRALAGPDRRVLVQAESHLYNDSGDCVETLSGLNVIPLAAGEASFSRSDVEAWVERSGTGRVETRVGVISIENPVRRKDHQMFDAVALNSICSYARDHGIRLHLDGARLFTLPLHSGKSVQELAAPFDTVYVSLWKHFNGASGAILAGDEKIIHSMYHTRRMFGGSLPQAWPQIGLVPRYARSFPADYARAWHDADELIALLNTDRRFKVSKIPNGTSRFFVEIPGTAPELVVQRLLAQGVTIAAPHPGTRTFPLQVNATILRSTPSALMHKFLESVAV